MVAVDALGPIADSIPHKRHVLVIVDCFTRFISATAADTLEGRIFVDYFDNHIGRYGVPQVLVSDNGGLNVDFSGSLSYFQNSYCSEHYYSDTLKPLSLFNKTSKGPFDNISYSATMKS